MESAVYKPFGEQTEFVQPGLAAPETKGWIGERYDADAGLQYLNTGYHDPVLGMLRQPDWWEVNSPGVETNRFSYSLNDPVNKLDPMGNQTYKSGVCGVCDAIRSIFGGGTRRTSSERAEGILKDLGRGMVRETAKLPSRVGGGVMGAYEFTRKRTVTGGLLLPDVEKNAIGRCARNYRCSPWANKGTG